MQLRRNSINLSAVLAKMREYHGLSSKATFWFGGILSLLEEYEKSDIHDDISLDEKIQMVKISSRALSSISNFYEQQHPTSIYKLLNFIQTLFDQLQGNKQYGIVISKITYFNILSIYAIKTHQYSYALNIFNEILEVYYSRVIDNTNQFFLAFLNNYLTFLKKSNKKMTSKMLEIQNLLKDLFVKFFTKIMVFDRATNQQNFMGRLNILITVFKQNDSLFAKYEKDMNSLILHSYQPQMKSKKKIPQDMISYIYKQKIKKNIFLKIFFNEDEIKFYSAHKGRVTQSLVMKKHQEDEQPEKRLTKIEAMLEHSIEMLNEQKVSSVRYNNLQRNQTLRLNETLGLSTIQASLPLTTKAADFQQKNIQTLQPLPRAFTKKRQMQISRPIKPIIKLVRFKPTIFKIRSIFIEINEDGILLSDYTKQNKRYVEWNTLSLIIEKIDLHFPFEQFLKIPLENYYDFVRIISFYLTKDDSKQICLVPKPLPLLQVNELIKLYKQEGKYLKLALMNRYDTEKFIGIIDCFMAQFSEFFKYLNDNEYLFILNEKILKGKEAFDREENTYLMDYIKRKRETTVAQLSNQLQSEHLEYVIEEKNTIYKCLFLLKNNLQIYVKILDNIKFGVGFEGYVIEIKIDNVNKIGNETFYLSSEKDVNISNDKKISKVVEIPIEKLTNFFPPYNLGLREYLNLYSRTIVDMLNYFDDYSEEVNLGGLSFQVKIHACRTQMIEYGKYYSVVSAEVVGSKERAWAMIIRFYDLAYVNTKITVLTNPYHEFLQCLVTANSEQKDQIMKNLLVNGSVKDTYNWLKKANKLQRKINLFEYLYANQLI